MTVVLTKKILEEVRNRECKLQAILDRVYDQAVYDPMEDGFKDRSGSKLTSYFSEITDDAVYGFIATDIDYGYSCEWPKSIFTDEELGFISKALELGL